MLRHTSNALWPIQGHCVHQTISVSTASKNKPSVPTKCPWQGWGSEQHQNKELTSEESSVSPSSTSWSSVSTRIMLGRMFFRSCCVRPLNLADLTVEHRIPSSSVPRTANTRAQQEYFIVLGPVSQNWQNVSVSRVLVVWTVKRKSEREKPKWNPSPEHSCTKTPAKKSELAHPLAEGL